MPPDLFTIYIINMVIKNKDGSVYKVRGPNPIMMSQEVWDNFEVHNMDFSPDIVNNKQNPQKPNKKLDFGTTTTVTAEQQKPEMPTPPPPPKEAKIKEEVKIQEFEIPDFTKPEPTQSPQPETDEEVLRPQTVNEKLRNYKKDIMYCMLAETKEVVDPLYSDKTVKIKYTRNFVFENFIIKEDDMELIFWSHLDFLTKNSILYPKNDTRRWWKINSVRSAPEGCFIVCGPTDIQTSFKL